MGKFKFISSIIKHIRRVVFFILLIIFYSSSAPAAISEEAVKAAFIFHFINFTQWNDESSNYYVCVPEDAQLRSAIRESLNGKAVNNRRITVVNRTKDCHILISDDVEPSTSILTVGPLAKGALLEFRVVDNKLKFAANLDEIKKSDVKISSQLLKLAILENGS